MIKSKRSRRGQYRKAEGRPSVLDGIAKDGTATVRLVRDDIHNPAPGGVTMYVAQVGPGRIQVRVDIPPLPLEWPEAQRLFRQLRALLEIRRSELKRMNNGNRGISSKS